MLTSFAEDELLFNAISAGAVGYVLKQVGNDDLIRAIETVARGEALLDPSVTGQVLAKLREATRVEAFVDLTDQELKVLGLIARTPITPSTITWLGFLIAVGATVLIVTGHLLAAGFVVLVGGLFDMLDGHPDVSSSESSLAFLDLCPSSVP